MWSQSLTEGKKKNLNYTLKGLLEKAPLGNPDCHLAHIGCADLFSIASFVPSTGHHTQGGLASEISTTELISSHKVLFLVFIHLFYILASTSLLSLPPPNLHHKSTLRLTKILLGLALNGRALAYQV